MSIVPGRPIPSGLSRDINALRAGDSAAVFAWFWRRRPRCSSTPTGNSTARNSSGSRWRLQRRRVSDGHAGHQREGITFLHWEIDSFFSTDSMTKEAFYRFLFSSFGVPIWLTWAATILAAQSARLPSSRTSSPRGSIELTLSRPISRLRLLMTSSSRACCSPGCRCCCSRGCGS